MREHLLSGRIVNLRIFNVPDFGTRASFKLECPERHPVTCAVAREFVTCYRGRRPCRSDGYFRGATLDSRLPDTLVRPPPCPQGARPGSGLGCCISRARIFLSSVKHLTPLCALLASPR